MSISAIIAAGGSGERFGAGYPKALIQLADKTLLSHAIESLAPLVDQLIITAPAGFEKQISELVGEAIIVVTGGSTRSESVRNGLAAVTGGLVLVHDAARALASRDLAARVIAELERGEIAVVPGIPVVDTIKVTNGDGYVVSTLDRASLISIQTPQGFKTSHLRDAHASANDATDDAALIEAQGGKVKVIKGEDRALKITTPADLSTALSFLGLGREIRTGVGVDAHVFGQGRPMHLAGLHWPDEEGVDGHSDGDVAAHAICDALFAATGLGDLGSNFGTDRPEYEGASGTRLMQEAHQMINKAGYTISNVTVQIIGNRPKIGKRRPEAIDAISKALGGAHVSVSATTTDGMGLTGEGKGIAAIATALVYKQ
ncbi:MAG: 2-C-methyl-D-erythritol 4-phosphate cytidylyltransferase [Actinomycetes bacterium]|jgi:2-C-methyl-D-erythritol 4-phosphate cytidylyltransferase/2-C-methyl-D-erythritol 2,4-cyclodiphosphate synthase